LQSIALDVLNGAQDTDAQIVSNKLVAAGAYTDTVENAGASVEAADAENVIAGVDETAASVEAAREFAEQAVSDDAGGAGGTGIAVSGQVFEVDTPVTGLSGTAERVDVGRDAAGSVTISNGSTLTAQSGTDDGAVELGIETTGAGVLNIDGEGSQLATIGANNGVRTGMAGTGTLSVTNGGSLSTLYLGAGFQNEGVITISGAGSLATVSPAGGYFSGEDSDQAGLVSVGYEAGSRGELNVTNGGRLDVLSDATTNWPGIFIARDAGSVGVVDIDGGTALVSALASDAPTGAFVHVGRYGQGVMTVQNGGALDMQGAVSSLSVGRYDGSEGSLDILSGGRVDTLVLSVGRDGATGTVTVSGETSVLSVTGTIGPGHEDSGSGAYAAIGRGDGGIGSVTVSNGALFELETQEGETLDLHLGRDTGSSGRLVVSGSGSTVIVDNKNADQNDSGIKVGREGDGTLIVESGGKFESDYYFGIGHDTGATGQVDVIGQGSEIVISGAAGPQSGSEGDGGVLKVGRAGDGELNIREGGLVTVSGQDGSNPFMSVGDRAGGNGSLTVDGAGSHLRVVSDDSPDAFGGNVVIGRETMGTLTITGGGQVSLEGNNMFLTVGDRDGGNGTVTIEGEGSKLDAGVSLTLGFDGGVGNVTVGGGGTLTAGNAGDGEVDIFINSGSSLRVLDGGILNGDVQNDGGIFEPGNSPGHVTITGDFVSQGDLVLEVEGPNANAFDQIDVGGTATLSGEIVIDFSAAKGLDAGDEWTLIETDDGLNAENADFIVRGLDPDLEASVSVGALGVSVDLDAA
jgi:T5SS/PEP-CTERM-associated repeat protein